MAVERYDDLDGTANAETVSFCLDGKVFEIDLSEENAAAFRGTFRPYLTKAREVGVAVCLPAEIQHSTGRLTLTGAASVLARPAAATATGSRGGAYSSDRSSRPALQLASDTPAIPTQPAETSPTEDSPAGRPGGRAADALHERSYASDSEVRTWANRYQVPNTPTRGRIPDRIRKVHDAFHAGDKGPWQALLREVGIDPDKAEVKARALTAVDSKKQPAPTQEELDRKAAQQIRKLTSAQLTRLRRMFSSPDGRATTTRMNGDATSFEALANRGCCILVAVNEEERTETYEITNVGRLWFDVRGIDPVGT
ncbi:histone-like nucleoid-structuring protein Lsr2 [Streptomyces scabiei]|uniref:Lsr2 dimerization domain-containing protein n=1 Tax=Streptomyces scabiei TaxID=1930 RepID=UPI0033E7B132